ncbi:hypothetical protein LSH36_134g00008 [Paralvinella palmiformis]|uniref:Uncharacterized protein n=1 Tax=Paralvinella palmiformis TaxID=53620 RepID=A0AAD9JVU9_9ANNE|nr:hypothetical protein LSH36_134g00008 [Paralvinella palmiformis]
MKRVKPVKMTTNVRTTPLKGEMALCALTFSPIDLPVTTTTRYAT